MAFEIYVPAPHEPPLTNPLKPYGLALQDYFEGNREAVLTVLHSLEGTCELDPAFFFRDEAGLLEFEETALGLTRGTVLDVGAGAGVHSLILQNRGHEVLAAEPVPQAVQVLRRRGVRRIFGGAIEQAQPEPVATVLLLTNGTGIAGTLEGLARLLDGLRPWLKPDGQILIDSTDPGEADGQPYPGEAWIQLGYRGHWGRPYRELYAGPGPLGRLAQAAGFQTQVVFQEADGTYLARLTLR